MTDVVAFIAAPIDDVRDTILDWQELKPSCLPFMKPPAREGAGNLEDALRRIHHLGIPPQLELLLETRTQWTALFDGGANGGDHFSFVTILSERLHSRAAIVRLIENRPRSGSRPGRYGVVGLSLWLPTDAESEVRDVSAANDGGTWAWDESGPVQPFERIESYQTKRIRDRLSPELLIEYCDQLDIPMLREDDYGPRNVLIDLGHGRANLTLAQARGRLGLDATMTSIDA
jgi:hypothetical protein